MTHFILIAIVFWGEGARPLPTVAFETHQACALAAESLEASVDKATAEYVGKGRLAWTCAQSDAR